MQAHTYTSYSWPEATASVQSSGQVSRLIGSGSTSHRIRYLPGFPVICQRLLPNYGDEFVQDLHLFPFSPDTMPWPGPGSDT